MHSGKVLKCSGCQYVFYCNRECQTNAWKNHKTECVCLKRAAGKIVPDAARVMARIILKLNDGGDAEKGYYTEKFYRKFKDLMSRKQIFSNVSTQTQNHLFQSLNFDLYLIFYVYIFVSNFVPIDSLDIQSDQRRIEHVESLKAVLHDILTVDLMPNETDFLAIYGRVSFECNVFFMHFSLVRTI